MGGIVGCAYRDPNRQADRQTLQTMAERLTCRGPDGEGFPLAQGAGLAVRTLDGVDLGSADQPAYNEDRSVIVICDGRIYNCEELRSELSAAGHRLTTVSEAELIAHLYEEQGVDCVHRLRGMFAFALWDERRRRLLLARDRLGIKSLCYTETSEGLAFASEQKALLILPSFPREVDPTALEEVLTFGFAVGPKTLFRGLMNLPPGCRLMYREGQATLEHYWDLPGPATDERDRRRGAAEWAELLREKLEESVRIHLPGDLPVGAWLSGGVDSSAVVALMRPNLEGPLPVTLLSFATAGFDEVHTQCTLLDFPDYDLRGRIALCGGDGLRRLPEALWYCEEPTSSGLEVVRLLLVEASAHDAQVVLAGEGADEVFGGYPWFRLDKVLQLARPLPRVVRRALARVPLFPSRYLGLRRLLADPRPLNLERYRDTAVRFPDEGSEVLSPELRAELGPAGPPADLPLPPGFRHWDRFSQLQYYEVHVRLASFVLGRLDRSAMARSLEVRVPFLDHELVELASRIPPTLKLRRLREKYILRRAVQDVLPGELAWRPKRGLRAPAAAWMRADLPEFAEALLSQRALRRTGYFDPAGVQKLLAEHRAGQADWGHRLVGVLAVQLWDHMFRQRGGPPAC